MKNNLAQFRPQKSGSEKKITIIQCPSCQTKFAVETALIESAEEARFHCSRCDNVFMAEKTSFQPPSPPAQSIAKAQASQSEHRSSPPQNKTPSMESQFEFSWEKGKLTENKESISFDAPDFSVSVANDTDDSNFSIGSIDDDLSPISDESLEKDLFGGLEITPGLAATPITDEPMGYGSLTRTSTREFSTDWDTTETVSPLKPTESGAIAAPKMATYWKSFWTIAGPVGGYAFSLAVVTVLTLSNPRMMHSALPAGGTGQVTAPPPELYITGTSVKRVTLETGESVSVISGKIVNDSSTDFSEVQIEGILFDEDGQVVAKRKINAGSALGKSRIQSLSGQMIDDLQNSRPAKRFELKAGQDYDFTMAVREEGNGGETIYPEYFNSRVYSVRAL